MSWRKNLGQRKPGRIFSCSACSITGWKSFSPIPAAPACRSTRRSRASAARLRTILPRHEQGGGFAAEGYARSTGRVGVCVATSGPGATNLVTCLADAKLDSIPLLAITGQVGTAVIGTDAFQETPIVEICRAITKHHYLVTRTEDLPRVFKEAFHIASTGRPGPVIVDVPKDVQNHKIVPNYDPPMNLPGYQPERYASRRELAAVLEAIRHSRKADHLCRRRHHRRPAPLRSCGRLPSVPAFRSP